MFIVTQCKSRQRQAGAVLVEFAIQVMLLVTLMAMALQVGRALTTYNVIMSSSYSATMYLATMPDAELLNGPAARATATQIVTRMRTAGAIDVSTYPVDVAITCTNSLAAPCGGSGKATQVHVRVTHFLQDFLMPFFTQGDVDNQIDQIPLRSRVRIPRVGFVST